jgi:hypothetical protein
MHGLASRLLGSLLLLLPLVDLTCVLGRVVGPLGHVSEVINALRDDFVEQIILAPGVFTLDALSGSAGGALTIGPNRAVELIGAQTVTEMPNSTDAQWVRSPVFRYASGLDFGNSAPGMFRLGDNTTLGFRNLFLWNGLSQLGYDWQVVTLAQPGAR